MNWLLCQILFAVVIPRSTSGPATASIPMYSRSVATGSMHLNPSRSAPRSFERSVPLVVPREAGRLNVESAGWKVPGDGHVVVEVDVRTLDEYDLRNVCFIKIDVEGHELEVLKGGVRTIDRERPTLLVEIEQRHLACPMQVVFDYLGEFGYRGFFFHDGGLRALSEFSADLHQRLPFLPNGLARDYVNNFVFLG